MLNFTNFSIDKLLLINFNEDDIVLCGQTQLADCQIVTTLPTTIHHPTPYNQTQV